MVEIVSPPKVLAATLVDVFRAHESAISAFAGINELPVDLMLESREDCRIGLVSDGLRNVQLARFPAPGLQRYFHAVAFSVELGKDCWKPSSLLFMEVLLRPGRGPDATVYVVENPLKDFLGARRAELQSIRLQMSICVCAHLQPITGRIYP